MPSSRDIGETGEIELEYRVQNHFEKELASEILYTPAWDLLRLLEARKDEIESDIEAYTTLAQSQLSTPESIARANQKLDELHVEWVKLSERIADAYARSLSGH